MQFFLDTANLSEIERGLEWGMVDGITTNPSLLGKEGKTYLAAVKEIADLVPGPVSGEVLATEYDGMMDEAVEILAPRRISELPVVDTYGRPRGMLDITDAIEWCPRPVQPLEGDDTTPSPETGDPGTVPFQGS